MLKKMFLGLLVLMFSQSVHTTKFEGVIQAPVKMTYSVSIPWLKPLCNAIKGTGYGAAAGALVGFAGYIFLKKRRDHNAPGIIVAGATLGTLIGFYSGVYLVSHK